MKCDEVRPLVDGFVDGSLDTRVAARIQEHASGCASCTEQIALARRLIAALGAAHPVRAPKGFTDKVMAEVYRQALRGEPQRAQSRDVADRPLRAPSHIYRRMGLSFVVTAAVLAGSLLLPRVAYPTLFASRTAGTGGTSVVQEVMHGADGVVQGILMEQSNGGNAR